MTIEFKEWPKISRLNRDIIITEKIDGTNAAVGIHRFPTSHILFDPTSKRGWDAARMVDYDNDTWGVYAQSRTRIITPEQDNHGFAKWVYEYALDLVASLGEGLHFGEWWGSGIQRGYGLKNGEKRFSLFNTLRYSKPEFDLTGVPGLGTVPVLYEGLFSQHEIMQSLGHLVAHGSQAVSGFMDPEGIVVFHTASQTPYKVTIKNDEVPKAVAEKLAKVGA